MAAEHHIPFVGAENYACLDKLLEAVAYTDDFSLLKYIYSLNSKKCTLSFNSYLDVTYLYQSLFTGWRGEDKMWEILGYRNKNEWITELNPVELDIKEKIICGALCGGHLQLAEKYLTPGFTITVDILVASVKSQEINLVKHILNSFTDLYYREEDDTQSFDIGIDTALAEAIKGRNTELIELFIGWRKNYTPYSIYQAAKQGHWDLLSRLTNEITNQHCWSLGLKGASEGCHYPIIDYMIEKGADLMYGLQGAIIGGQIPIIDYLYKKGATDDFHQGLDNAVSYNRLDIISYLLKLYSYTLNLFWK